jgi:hypothetical protein
MMTRRIGIAAGVAALVSGAIWMVRTREAANDAPGRVTLKSSGVSYSLNSAAKLPDWVPVYPGSAPQGVYSDSPGGETRHMYSFKCGDATDQVAAYFQNQLEHAGFRVSKQLQPEKGGLLNAESGDKRRTVELTVTTREGATQASVMAIERK